jgi:transglutaminase-like putative cysteine protease
MTILQVRHRTTYRYSTPVHFGVHRMMFRPRDSHDQRLLESGYEIAPMPAGSHWIHDVFGNSITVVDFDTPAAELRFETRIVLEHTPENGPHARIEEFARHWPFSYGEDTLPDLAPVIRPHYPDPAVDAFARKFLDPSGRTETGRLLMSLTAGIRETLRYSRRTDPGTQPPALTLERGTGTCRDYALLMMECVRTLGFAARFVTGYIFSQSRNANPGLGGGATHAWVQVFLPGAGWVEFDPTNGIVGNEDLIRVGVARDPRQARPLTGSFAGNRSAYLGMEVQVNVTSRAPLAVAAE